MMKRILYLVFSLLLAIPCNGQAKPNQKNEKIQSEKIAFFTSEMDLSAEEAQAFWPIYNKYWKESKIAHKATIVALRAMMAKNEETLTEKEMDKRISAYFKALQDEKNVITDYYPKFKQVLPIEKVAKLYIAEEKFRMKMIQSLGKESNPAPAPGKGPAHKSPEVVE